MIQFHRDDLACPFTEVAGEAAEAGADFQNSRAFRDPGGVCDPRKDRVIRKKILAQPLVRTEVIFCEKFLRRRRFDHCNTHTISAGTGVRK